MYSRFFIDLLTESVGKDAAGAALEAFSAPPSVSVRLNPAKSSALSLDGVRQEPVPWSPHGFFLSGRPSFTLDPLFHAGAYYVQDSSAMAVGAVFREFAARYREGRVLKVLDLCAAPGGKTTDLAASLREICGDDFLVAANEVVRARALVLRENVARWGDPNVVVTSADPSAFSSLEGFFDIVVADVPCSGEGMFRKEPDAVRDWSPETVKLCASRQRRIIADVWPALRPGGLMIYSTCTFNHFENGDNVRWIAEELGAEILSPASCAGVVKTAEGLSLVPGLVRGEGQFVAALEKCPGAGERRCRPGWLYRGSMPPETASSLSRPSARQSRPGGLYRGSMPPETALSLPSHAHRCRPGGLYRESMPPETASVLAFTASFSLRGDTVIAVPAAIEKEVQELGSLHPMSTGVAIGTLKGDTLVPSADLALSTGLRAGAFPRFNLSEEEAVRFLRRDSILTPGAPNGYVLVCFRDTPLGFVKNLGNRCNNLHPASRRILQR